ncbi:hypothetical protein [Nocardioides sp. YIM 152315]|uniref:hypothetical protein n=1 Tax=Nocardioides sp. YIM 152315 TaxID=3031760 RepID=UPI0023DB40EB|nr:hypothetical protein [Nocardioides sp. YIM 152315]MDF1605868.1 hypothetical protein [Nocardioides sp. YIM 152315]
MILPLRGGAMLPLSRRNDATWSMPAPEGVNNLMRCDTWRCLDMLLGASTAQLYNRLTADDFSDATQMLIIEAQPDDLSTIDEGWFPDECTVDPATGSVSLTVG